MHGKHQRFWKEADIQHFWSGHSFGRTDDGNSLSYDLARIIVEQLAKDWESFKRFVLAARHDDGGEAAARERLPGRLLRTSGRGKKLLRFEESIEKALDGGV